MPYQTYIKKHNSQENKQRRKTIKMGRKARLRKEKLLIKKQSCQSSKSSVNISNKLTKSFQENIKKSPMWKEMVKEFGKEKALELLKECKANFE